MRRLLPVILCVASTTGLAACDQEPVGPPSDEGRELYDTVRAAGGIPGPPAFADGDVALSRPAGGGGVGGDIIVFDIVDSVARTGDGTVIQIIGELTISAPDGDVLCTRGTQGGFVQLRDADGTVLFSSIGPFVFDGQPQLAGKNPFQQAVELASRLRFSFDISVVVEGFANSGEEMVTADVPVQFSSAWRKVTIAALVDGYCGSDGLTE